MSKKLKVIVASVLLAAFVVVYGFSMFSVFGAGQKDIDAARQSQKENQALINKVKKEKQTAVAAKEEIDKKIDALDADISVINKEISESEAVIAEKQKELDAALDAVQKQDDRLKSRLRFLYEDGLTSYLEILFSSESFSDFVSRYNMIGEILEYDNRVLSQKKEESEVIKEKKEALEAEKAKQVAAKNRLVSAENELEVKQQQQQSYLKALEKDLKAYEKALAQAEAEEQRILAQIRAQQQAAAGNGNVKTYTGTYTWPSPGYNTITCAFGPRIHPITKKASNHTGVDIGVPSGSKIVAIADGTVTMAGWNSVYGYYVTIDHGGVTSLYGHNSSLTVSTGQKVTKGQKIANSGSTGWSTGPHLHFEVVKNGTAINPMGLY